VFGYDATSNRTSHTRTDGTTVGYTVDAAGQLVTDTDGVTYSYDGSGNLTGTSAGDVYGWDDYGRLASATLDGTPQSYSYDAAGVRTSVDGTGQVWDRAGLPTLVSAGTDSYAHTSAGVGRSNDGWILVDAVGSVRAVTDGAGVVGSQTAYTAFGEPIAPTPGFGFTGEQQDQTGLQHLRARQYNPALGRFLSVDPIQPGAPGTTGWGLYGYAGSNPTTATDPTGSVALTEYGVKVSKGAAAGAVFGYGSSYWSCDTSGNEWWKPSNSRDADCVATEILLGVLFGGLGGPAFSGKAPLLQNAGLACLWGALEGGTGAWAHGQVQGNAVSGREAGASALFGCALAGAVTGLGSAIGDIGTHAFGQPAPVYKGPNPGQEVGPGQVGVNRGPYEPDGPILGQMQSYSCAAASCAMVAGGPEAFWRTMAGTNTDGTAMSGVESALREAGFVAERFEGLSLSDLSIATQNGPAIVGGNGHAVVVDLVADNVVYIRDPLPLGDGSAYSVPSAVFDDWWNGRGVLPYGR